MKSEQNKNKIIEKFASVDNDTRIEDVLNIVEEYYIQFPESCYSDLAACPYKHKKIGQAIAIHFIHNFHKEPLETAVLNIMGEEIEKELAARVIDYDHAIQSMKCSDLIQRFAQAVKKADFVIPKAYSSSDIFNPRLFIIGYRYEDPEFIASVAPILDIITAKKTVFGVDEVDSKQGWSGKDKHPSIQNHANEAYGLDDKTLMTAGENGSIPYFSAVEKRVYQAIVPNLRLMHNDYQNENIVALLQTHLSLKKRALYRELETHGIDYITIVPRKGKSWERSDQNMHRMQLNTLVEDENNLKFLK